MKKDATPVSLRILLAVVGVYFAIAAMSSAAGILIPLALSLLFALLLLPLARSLENKGVPPLAATIVSILVGTLIFAAILGVLSFALRNFLGDLPFVQERLFSKFNRIQGVIDRTTGIDPSAQVAWLQKKINEALAVDTETLQGALRTTTGVVSALVLVPVYTALLILYRRRFRLGLLSFFEKRGAAEASDVLHRIQRVIQQYLTGLLTVMYITAVLNTLALFIVGLEHALFFGILASLLTIIPFVGTVIGSLLPALFALVTRDSLLTPLIIIALFSFIQLLDDNIITPHIVGKRIALNPLVALLAVFAGGAIWGIWGMMLFLPFAAVTKIICDHISALRPFGLLMGLNEHDIGKKGGRSGTDA